MIGRQAQVGTPRLSGSQMLRLIHNDWDLGVQLLLDCLVMGEM